MKYSGLLTVVRALYAEQKRCIVREGFGKNSKQLGMLDRGDRFYVLEMKEARPITPRLLPFSLPAPVPPAAFLETRVSCICSACFLGQGCVIHLTTRQQNPDFDRGFLAPRFVY